MDKKYYPTIGLEIHAELKTNTKMFCGCKNPAGMRSASNGAGDPEIPPNTLICPVCMAHPGALPVLNKKAIENVIKVGLAIDGKIADFTEFDRKNYFYPDIPKGYQISQYKFPIVSGGELLGVKITRVHLEEDTANSKHFEDSKDGSLASVGAGFSLIDFNRSGVPLMELVTEPHTFESSEEAARKTTKFAKEFQLILWYLGVSEANMEKGEMRVEANISVSTDPKILGTKVEVKNLNSFRSVERAVLYELDRMTDLLENGKGSEVVQETRGWDEGKQKTFSQRKKESSEDYRYFPEPDLPKLKLHKAFDLKQMKKDLPELPEAKRARYKKDFGIKDEDIETLVVSKVFMDYLEFSIDLLEKDKKLIQIFINFLLNDILGLVLNSEKPVSLIKKMPQEKLVKITKMFAGSEISSRAAKDIIAIIWIKGGEPKEIALKNNMLQSSDEGALKGIVEKIIKENPEIVASYKSGKKNAIMSLVGKIIKESNGSANPQIVIKLLKEMLK